MFGGLVKVNPLMVGYSTNTVTLLNTLAAILVGLFILAITIGLVTLKESRPITNTGSLSWTSTSLV